MKVKRGCKQSEVGMIPEDWNMKTLGKLTTTVASGEQRWMKYLESTRFMDQQALLVTQRIRSMKAMLF